MTPKQQAFLGRLLTERDTTGMVIPESTTGLSTRAASALIDALCKAPRKPGFEGPVATEKQRAYVHRLIDSKEVNGDRAALHKRVSNGISMELCSKWIDELRKRPDADPEDVPKRSKVTLPDPDELPDGRYAVKVGGQWRLVRVWRGTRQPNPGWPVQLYAVRGTEKGTRIAPPGDEAKVAREIVKQGAGECAREFGKRTGSCSRCGTELDVNLSRALKIGPVCLEHWYGKEPARVMKADARARLRAKGIEPTEKFDDLEPKQLRFVQALSIPTPKEGS